MKEWKERGGFTQGAERGVAENNYNYCSNREK